MGREEGKEGGTHHKLWMGGWGLGKAPAKLWMGGWGLGDTAPPPPPHAHCCVATA